MIKIKDKFCHMIDARFTKAESLRAQIQSILDKTKNCQGAFVHMVLAEREKYCSYENSLG